MDSAIHIDWGFIAFTVLVFGGTAGALLCFRHMLHEGHDEKSDKNQGSKHESGAPIQY
jgi:hypothetical protein